jgi:laminin, alpha 3/5
VESGVAPINDQQNEIHMDLRVSRPGSYVLLLVYVTPPNGHRSHVDVDVSTQQERQSGQAVLYDCTSSHTCRQIVTDAQGKIAHFNFDSNYVR